MNYKFKKIIGGTEEELYAKFPWLEKAKIRIAVVDMKHLNLIWENGVWENGDKPMVSVE